MQTTLPDETPARNLDLDTIVSELFGLRPEYRAAIATIAEKAKAALPECNGRVEKAAALVLAGDVALHADGSATVGSATDPAAAYEINGHCDCTDFARAPHGFASTGSAPPSPKPRATWGRPRPGLPQSPHQRRGLEAPAGGTCASPCTARGAIDLARQ